MSAAVRRDWVVAVVEGYGVSQRRACRIVSVSRTVARYQGRAREDLAVVSALQERAEQHPRWGFGKLFASLRLEGHHWNHKRVYRVYCALKLNLRIQRRKRLPKRFPQVLAQPSAPNHCWSMDFMSDALVSGKRFRTLNIIDDFDRQALAIEVDRSFPAARVVRVLDQLADWQGLPRLIRCDNGPEFISATLMDWAQRHHVTLDFIRPGQPAQNAYIERFNRTYREEVLDSYLFRSLQEVRQITHQWMNRYNQQRPHDALQGLTPAGFRLAAGFALHF